MLILNFLCFFDNTLQDQNIDDFIPLNQEKIHQCKFIVNSKLRKYHSDSVLNFGLPPIV